MLVAIHQPHYLPWLRYIEKIARADVFILLDDVHFTKNGWQNRNRIKTVNGPALLTVPVYQKAEQRLHEVRINNETRWREKHRRTIEQAYVRAPYFGDLMPGVTEIYAADYDRLVDLNDRMLRFFLETMNVKTRIHRATDLAVPGAATDRLVNLIRAVGGDTYYSGAYALDVYLDANALANAGIALELQQWHAPVYPQRHGEFVADLSVLDLLMNCGRDSTEVLLGKTPKPAV
ncbi:MAG: WbqC family protein [Candidatus Hydrogenedentales bacterium]